MQCRHIQTHISRYELSKSEKKTITQNFIVKLCYFKLEVETLLYVKYVNLTSYCCEEGKYSHRQAADVRSKSSTQLHTVRPFPS